MLCFVGPVACKDLSHRASAQLSKAFRPKTRQCYARLFRNFVGFCVCAHVAVQECSLSLVLSFLEFLVVNNVSVAMLSNYISALKAMFIVYTLPIQVFGHPQVTYYIKSIKINRPLSARIKNVIDLPTLKRLIELSVRLSNGIVFKAMFLVG